jgi:hypothetical protein
MSASEKLKELTTREYRSVSVMGTQENTVVFNDKLWAALPQIVAVVEAAEKSVRVGAHGPLGSALAALEEALS